MNGGVGVHEVPAQHQLVEEMVGQPMSLRGAHSSKQGYHKLCNELVGVTREFACFAGGHFGVISLVVATQSTHEARSTVNNLLHCIPNGHAPEKLLVRWLMYGYDLIVVAVLSTVEQGL